MAEEEEMRKQTSDSNSGSDSESEPHSASKSGAEAEASKSGAEAEAEASKSGAAAEAVPLALKPKYMASSSKVFSDEDVIYLLKKYVDFRVDGKKGKWVEFQKVVQNDLSKPDFTRTQIREKIRSLNRKFKSNWYRAQANIHVSDDSHELLVYDLSKALWEDDMNKTSESEITNQATTKRKQANLTITDEGHMPNTKKRKQEMITLDEFQAIYPHLYASFNMFGCPKIVKEKCALIGRDNAEKLEHEWRELNAELHRYELKKLALPSQRNQG